MKRLQKWMGLLLTALLLAAAIAPCASASALYDYNDYTQYEGLLGAMEVCNVSSWASLRALPDSSSARLAKVPAGAIVTSCYYENDRFIYCIYGGIEGYILADNLSFLSGPVGYEYPESDYLGNMVIVNCRSYASLRVSPDSRSQRIATVPLGSIVTNCFYHDARFSYCVFGDLEGYILNENLSALPGSYSYDSYTSYGSYDTYADSYIGDCVIYNCLVYASLRELPDTRATRLAKVPLGAVVTNCYYVSDKFACCTYNGIVGYILISNLAQ